MAREAPMNVHQAERPRREPFGRGAALLLTAGGDERIHIDPATGRNRYATTATPRPHEIFLSSSTASTISPRAYRAVESAWAGLSTDSAGGHSRIEAWFDEIRARLLALFGVAGGNVVLACSGTEVELIALAIARSIAPGPVTNIVLAPAETGSGVLRAASGRHFLDTTPFGEGGCAGKPLRGWTDDDVTLATVEIRDCAGNLRPPVAIDAEARDLAHAALAAGRNVLLHRLEISKTGGSGLTVAAAAQIAAGAPGRVVVLVDCCQLRCSRRRIRGLLKRGFMVAITGSKFFGGPPFSGALLLPPQILGRIGHLALPDGLADYSSRLDWPDDLRASTELPWRNDVNLGLGLRWVAALEEMERFYALPDALSREVLICFEKEVRKRSQFVDHIHEIGGLAQFSGTPDSILSFAMSHPDGAPFSPGETTAIHARLRLPAPRSPGGENGDAWIFHLGQPVVIGPRMALRVCASAPLVSDIAERIIAGEYMENAFVRWVNTFDLLFVKWLQIMAEVSDQRHGASIRHHFERAP
jgi:hypothetical protein